MAWEEELSSSQNTKMMEKETKLLLVLKTQHVGSLKDNSKKIFSLASEECI